MNVDHKLFTHARINHIFSGGSGWGFQLHTRRCATKFYQYKTDTWEIEGGGGPCPLNNALESAHVIHQLHSIVVIITKVFGVGDQAME